MRAATLLVEAHRALVSQLLGDGEAVGVPVAAERQESSKKKASGKEVGESVGESRGDKARKHEWRGSDRRKRDNKTNKGHDSTKMQDHRGFTHPTSLCRRNFGTHLPLSGPQFPFVLSSTTRDEGSDNDQQEQEHEHCVVWQNKNNHYKDERLCVSPAAAVPLLLLGVEDVLEIAREELGEDLVGVEGVGPTILLVQDLGQGLAASPVGNRGPKPQWSHRTERTTIGSSAPWLVSVVVLALRFLHALLCVCFLSSSLSRKLNSR